MTKKKKAEDERDRDDAKTRASLPVAGEEAAAGPSAEDEAQEVRSSDEDFCRVSWSRCRSG